MPRVWCLAVWLAWVMACGQAEEVAGRSTTDLPVGAGNWRNFGWKVGTTHADVLKLGSKFRLSGIGDGKANDDWLRLFNHGNTGFSGGFAAGKLWGKSTFVTHLHLGNKWRLSADDGAKGKDWLRLSAARGNKLFGGFSAGKLHTKQLSVEGAIKTGSVTVANQFMLASSSKVDEWVRLLDPLTKDHPKKGGLALGNLKAIDIAVSSKVSTKYLQLGKKWRLSGDGDGIKTKSDDWLRLTSAKGNKMFGGFAADKMMTNALQVHKKATFKGEAAFDAATFKGKVTFKQHAQFDSIGGKSAQVGNIMLSNKKEPKHPARDCLHLYRADGRTHTGLELKSLWSQDATTSVLTLGPKWRLSAKGDKYHNDDWLRLTNAKNTGYYGGFAAKKMWTTKAYNHVIQLGTKWRLSGVGDKIKNDDWLRLMDVQNTKLSGGLLTLKMQTSRIEVKGHASVGVLRVNKTYKLSGSVRALKLMNKGKPGGLAVGRLAAQTLAITGQAQVSKLRAKMHASAKVLLADTHIVVARWRIGPPPAVKGKAAQQTNWLQLSSRSSPNKLENLHLGTLKSKNLITQGKATIAVASVKKLHTTRISAKTMQVSGVLRADKGVWVGNKKIVPLGDEVQALREELAGMKAMLASLQQQQQRR